MIRTYRSFAALLATVATVAALMVVPASSSAKTLELSLPQLGEIVCPIVGNGTGGLNGVLLALNIRICPS
jgi:hypothetical protein